MGWLDDVKAAKGEPVWLELVETLRTVTEGKIYLETPRARLTLLLANFYERIGNDPKSAPQLKAEATTASPFESIVKASDLMSELQVETYSSMDRKEKTEFILEQMRLLVIVAKEKDAKAKASKETAVDKDKKVLAADGETEWIKVRVGGRKIHEGFLTDKGNEVASISIYVGDGAADRAVEGAETQVLRFDDSIRLAPRLLPRRRQVLPQGVGNTDHQGGDGGAGQRGKVNRPLKRASSNSGSFRRWRTSSTTWCSHRTTTSSRT